MWNTLLWVNRPPWPCDPCGPITIQPSFSRTSLPHAHIGNSWRLWWLAGNPGCQRQSALTNKTHRLSLEWLIFIDSSKSAPNEPRTPSLSLLKQEHDTFGHVINVVFFKAPWKYQDDYHIYVQHTKMLLASDISIKLYRKKLHFIVCTEVLDFNLIVEVHNH